MTQAPPVPQANQSPYPATEPTRTHQQAQSSTPQATNDATPLASVRDRIAPLQANATSFAKSRPYATAALVGTVALALFGTLRGNAARKKAA